MSVEALVERLSKAHRERAVEGITLLGGEPFAQPAATAALAGAMRELGLSVMIFSGFELAELQSRPEARQLLDVCDLLVDGPYIAQEPEHSRRWIGSENQIMHALSPRYDMSEEQFRTANTVELRWKAGTLTVNGWPNESANVDLAEGIDPRFQKKRTHARKTKRGLS